MNEEKYLNAARLLHGHSFYLVREEDNMVLVGGKISSINAIVTAGTNADISWIRVSMIHLCTDSSRMDGNRAGDKLGYRYSWNTSIDVLKKNIDFMGSPMDINFRTNPSGIAVWPLIVMVNGKSIIDLIAGDITLYDLI